MPIIVPPEYGWDENKVREIEAHRRNTKAFIDYDPISIILNERNKTPTADGGYKFGAPVPRAAQIFRLIPQSDVMPQVQTPDGHTLLPTYVLLGEHSAIMERWDTFELEGVKFIIVSPIRPDFKLPFSLYERKADVARF